MNARLIAAAIAAMGLAGCSPDVTPPANPTQGSAASSGAPAQPQVAEAQQPAPAGAQEEQKKEEGASPATETKNEEGEKKTQ
ncbi:MAG: hypothetical protein HYY28_02055 [Betaproteobacteria bacterium]|nr:hypothetical protein [Betaproteobacteria bacterium]MBI2959071.1 hypothetical protein [Betaproteobacteria bacterium]